MNCPGTPPMAKSEASMITVVGGILTGMNQKSSRGQGGLCIMECFVHGG